MTEQDAEMAAEAALVDTMQKLATNWQAIYDHMAQGQPDDKKQYLADMMLTVAISNLAKVVDVGTAANMLELTARGLRDMAAKKKAAASRPAADVVALKRR